MRRGVGGDVEGRELNGPTQMPSITGEWDYVVQETSVEVLMDDSKHRQMKVGYAMHGRQVGRRVHKTRGWPQGARGLHSHIAGCTRPRLLSGIVPPCLFAS